MKHPSMLLVSAVLAVCATVTANLGRGRDAVPASLAWQTGVKVVYESFNMCTFFRQSASNILASTLPEFHGSPGNQLTIEEGACIPTVREMVKQLDNLQPADPKRSSFDVRVVFVFTRVDGVSVWLAADNFGQFEWANIKHEPPTLEQRKALWKLLPYEVVEQWPGPLKEEPKEKAQVREK